MKIDIKTRVEFPVSLGEEFVVRNGDGRGVERWRHIQSRSAGKTHERHTFDVQGYEDQTSGAAAA